MREVIYYLILLIGSAFGYSAFGPISLIETINEFLGNEVVVFFTWLVIIILFGWALKALAVNIFRKLRKRSCCLFGHEFHQVSRVYGSDTDTVYEECLYCEAKNPRMG